MTLAGLEEGSLGLPNVLVLVVLGFLAGCVGVWQSVRDLGREHPPPSTDLTLSGEPGDRPRPVAVPLRRSWAGRVWRYALGRSTDTVRMSHLAAAAPGSARAGGGR